MPTDTSRRSVAAAPLQAPEAAGERRDSYGEILKSSALIGGASVATVAVGVVRTKALAVLLGPGGFGLMGLYGSIVDLVLSVASLGIGSSGVRQIAEAAASGDTDRIARTVVVLRWTATGVGVLGLVLTVVFARPLSALTFGSDDYAGAVVLLSLAVFFRAVASGQGALIQGMRRIGDLAKLGVIGAVLGAAFSIGLVYFFGERGVAPSLVATAGVGLAASWWYSRKVAVRPPAMTPDDVRQEASSLLKLGFAFMASGVLMMGAAYAVRTIVLRFEGIDAAGLYSAAWTLGGLYVGIILQSMGADFYPRLVGAAEDHPRCNRMVNEQTYVSLILAGPGVIATLTLAPLIISAFYSPRFADAVEVLRWICLGIALRVITWPIGFIIVAKNRQAIFLSAEIAWTVVNVGLTWICVRNFGVSGAGIAFFGSYVFHGCIVYPIVRNLSAFRWSKANLRLGMIFVFSITLVFFSFYLLPTRMSTVFGITVMVMSGAYSIRALANVVSIDRVPRLVQRVLTLIQKARFSVRRLLGRLG